VDRERLTTTVLAVARLVERHPDVVRGYAEQGLGPAPITIRVRHRGDYSTGICYHDGERRIAITAPLDHALAAIRAIVAHEIAHRALPRAMAHGRRWRRLFSQIVGDTWGPYVETTGSYHDLHRAIVVALGGA
jgi:hypothetical protein